MKLKKQSEAQLKTAASLALSRTRDSPGWCWNWNSPSRNLQICNYKIFSIHTSSQILQGFAVFKNQHSFYLSLLHHHSVNFSQTVAISTQSVVYSAISSLKVKSFPMFSYLLCLSPYMFLREFSYQPNIVEKWREIQWTRRGKVWFLFLCHRWFSLNHQSDIFSCAVQKKWSSWWLTGQHCRHHHVDI